MANLAYAVIVPSCWMDETGHGTDYMMPTGRLGSLDSAIREGLRYCGHDDFNIGEFSDGRLVDLLWQHESLGEPPEQLDFIANQIGVRR